MKSFRWKAAAVVLLIGAAALVWALWARFSENGAVGGRRGGQGPAPVEVGPIETGPIARVRTFSGTLEAPAYFVVAPKVSGRVRLIRVDIGDPVRRGQTIVEMDDEEYVQSVIQAEAELAVAKANLTEARNALEIAERELQRVKTLRSGGVASESNLDAAMAGQLSKKAQVEVAKAQQTRAEATLKTARIRLGYTKVSADWSGDDDYRVVAERFVDEGETVSANTKLLSVVELDPITAVIFVGEKDYASLHGGLPATLTTDAYPGQTFAARVERIAPVFRQEVRQARVELTVQNTELRLKPGMFVRVTVELDRVEEAVIVPERALTRRGDRPGVFVVAADGRSVTWREVQVGIQQGDRVQVTGEGLEGRVVTLGQQLVEDGSSITIPAESEAGPSAPGEQTPP